MLAFTSPHLDYHALSPEIVLSVTLALVLLADLLLSREQKWVAGNLAAFGLLATLLAVISLALFGPDTRSMLGGAYVVDSFSLVLKGLVVAAGFVVLLMGTRYVEQLRRGGRLLRGGVLLPDPGLGDGHDHHCVGP